LKILVDVGLCICFYDFVEVGDPYIYPAEGAAHQLVKFRISENTLGNRRIFFSFFSSRFSTIHRRGDNGAIGIS